MKFVYNMWIRCIIKFVHFKSDPRKKFFKFAKTLYLVD